jgi:Carboxyltransferase domain, subdomain A and B/Biotin carboxylase C-terminal domain
MLLMSHFGAQNTAIECEDPCSPPHASSGQTDACVRPRSGVLGEVVWPEAPGLRIDSWVAPGSLISHNFDSLIAKVMLHAESREKAIARVRGALRAMRVKGIPTNQCLMEAVLEGEEFCGGLYDTHLLTRLTFEPSFAEVCRPRCILYCAMPIPACSRNCACPARLQGPAIEGALAAVHHSASACTCAQQPAASLSARAALPTALHVSVKPGRTSAAAPRPTCARAWLQVLDAGVMTTVQDWPGRTGLWHVGVPPSGPMDPLSLRFANALVGNPESAAVLEVTLAGPRLRFHRAATVAVCGGRFPVRLDGAEAPMWRPLTVPAGSELAVGAAEGGARCYVAVAGSFDAPVYLGSRATFPGGNLGGYQGRPLAVRPP